MCVGFEIAVNFHSDGKKMPKRQERLMNFFRLAGQSDPKQAEILLADQQCGDPGGHSSTSSSIMLVHFLLAKNMTHIGIKKMRMMRRRQTHFESQRLWCRWSREMCVYYGGTFVTFHTNAEIHYIKLWSMCCSSFLSLVSSSIPLPTNA